MDTRTANRVNSPERPKNPQVMTIGLCANREEEARLQAVGVKQTYVIGRNFECLRWALSWLRGRGGILKVATDLRIFGTTRATMMAALDECERQGVTVIDIAHPEDTTFAQRVKRALTAISNARFIGDRRKARREGAKGGTAKGIAAAAARAAVMADDAVRRLCAHPKLTWQDCADILGPLFSVSTLQRNYKF